MNRYPFYNRQVSHHEPFIKPQTIHLPVTSGNQHRTSELHHSLHQTAVTASGFHWANPAVSEAAASVANLGVSCKVKVVPLLRFNKG